jgi:hypothetical protein
MTETRPIGEQIRFVSAKTGEHVLDAYLEAAEKGTRTLPDMLEDLFDPTTGDLRTDNIQFRVNNATSQLEARVGDFADIVTGWQAVPNAFIFRNRGTYANATAYERLDIFTFGIASYVVTEAHTSNTASPDPAKTKLLLDGSGGVSTFNTRTGNVTLTSADVTSALGFTPYNATNPANYFNAASLDATAVNNALGYTAANAASVLALSGGTMTGFVTLHASPSNANHAATKGYVDSVATGLTPKDAVAVATTANITLSGEQTIDGFLTNASRVLVKNQTTGHQNGIYNSGPGAWTRATDSDTYAELAGGNVFVLNGTTNGGASFVCLNRATDGGTLGVTTISYSQNSSPTVNAGAGLSKTGNTLFIPSNAVTLAMMAQAPANTLRGNNTGGTANVADLTVSQVQSMLGLGSAAYQPTSAFAPAAGGGYVTKTGDTMSGTLTAVGFALDGNAYYTLSGGNPFVVWDAGGDSLQYIRGSNIYRFSIGGATVLDISTTAVNTPNTMQAGRFVSDGAVNQFQFRDRGNPGSDTNSFVVYNQTNALRLYASSTGTDRYVFGPSQATFQPPLNVVGTLSQNGNAVWHAGNLNPASYLPTTGGSLSGDLTIAKATPVLHLNGTTNSSAYFVLNNTLRQWSVGMNGGPGTQTFVIYDNTAGSTRFSINSSGDAALGGNLALGGSGLISASVPYMIQRASSGILFQDAGATNKAYLAWDNTLFSLLDGSGNPRLNLRYSDGIITANVGFSSGAYFQDSATSRINTRGGIRPLDVGGNSGHPGNDVYTWGYQEAGAWGSGFPDLVLAYHTGLKIGASNLYGGTRFYNDHPAGTSPVELMSVGNGDNNVRIANTLIMGGTMSVSHVTPSSFNLLRVANGSGSVDIGAKDGTYAYISTDRTYLQTSKPVVHEGRGGYLHNNDGSALGGRVFRSASMPGGMVNGDIWLQPL